MFLRKIQALKGSLSVRLTIWYAAVFTITSLLVLVIFYERVAFISMERIDEELAEELNEFSVQFPAEGLEETIKKMRLEADSEDKHDIFFRLISDKGDIIASSDMEPWGDIGLSQADVLSAIKESKPIFDTINVPGKEYDARTINGLIGPSIVMQIGLSLEDHEEYLNIFKTLVLLMLLPVFIIAALIGYFMAKKALSDLEEVTHIASEISLGAYDKRVHVENASIEIDSLAKAFNRMVDSLHALIKGMREMTDNIAHDLRIPLARIRGIAEMTLIGKKAQDDFKEMAISTVEECDNLINMINTMLDITETEAGYMGLNLETVDMSRLITDACDLYQSIAQEKNIEVKTYIPDGIFILTDKAKMQRLISNMLENAIKYTSKDGKVEVSLGEKDNHLLIRFEDTGVGISPSEIPKIFDRFYRCDNSRSEPGIGLGLSLAKAIVEAFGGSITIDSTLNKGSVFTLKLPIRN